MQHAQYPEILFLKALLCYIVALLHTTSSKFWCLSRLLFVTKYYQQQFSQHRRQAKCTAVPLKIVELSHSHATWLLVDTKSKIPLLNHQNRIETTVSTHTRKRSTSVCELLVYHLTQGFSNGSHLAPYGRNFEFLGGIGEEKLWMKKTCFYYQK